VLVVVVIGPGVAVTVTPESLPSGPPYSSCTETNPAHAPVRAGPAGPCGPVSLLQPATATRRASRQHRFLGTEGLLKGWFVPSDDRYVRGVNET
jgi:hypothetical protein